MEGSGGTGQTGCCEPTPCRKGKIDTHTAMGENKEETNLLFQSLIWKKKLPMASRISPMSTTKECCGSPMSHEWTWLELQTGIETSRLHSRPWLNRSSHWPWGPPLFHGLSLSVEIKDDLGWELTMTIPKFNSPLSHFSTFHVAQELTLSRQF